MLNAVIWKSGWGLTTMASFSRGAIFRSSRRVTPPPAWPPKRAPHLMESSLPGVFAVGDVWPGSVKRVTSAVVEGAISVGLVHRALTESIGGRYGNIGPIPWPNTRWSDAPPTDESCSKSIGLPLAAISGRSTVVDFVAVRSIEIHKSHQVPYVKPLILREENWVGNLVPSRVPEPIEAC